MKDKGLTDFREIQHWLVRNSVRGNCWVVISQIEKIVAHPEQILQDHEDNLLQPSDIHLSSTNLKYVYSAYLTKERLLTLVQDSQDNFYIIRNLNSDEKEEEKEGKEEEKEEIPKPKGIEQFPIQSRITKCPTLQIAIKKLTKPERRLLNILKITSMTLKQEDHERLNQILPIDFIQHHNSFEELKKLWIQYLKEQQELGKHSLDLSGHFNITTEVLESIDPVHTTGFREVVLYQNQQLQSFDWIARFQNLQTLSFWYCYQLQNQHIDQLAQQIPNLQSLNIHSCFQINNRVLIPLLQLEHLQKLCLDNRVMICQTNAYQGVITHKEWERLNNRSIEFLLINSDNLTNDQIDSILSTCHNLKKFLMNTLVLKRLRQNLEEGTEDDQVIFQSSDNLKIGFQARRPFRIKNLLKNQYEAPFSEPMLRVMEQERHDSDEEEPEKTPQELLEEELLKEIKEEFQAKNIEL